jgi:serine/threonine protein kinase
MKNISLKQIQKTSKRPRLVLNHNLKEGQELARGGEGKICQIVGSRDYVAKFFFTPGPEKDDKLKAMLANRPHDPTRETLQHISIAWPVNRILNDANECIGFAMPYIKRDESIPLLKLYNPRDRRATRRNFTWEYLVRIVLNLASIIDELHRKGYVIGDVNESNILVTPKALVTLVDCDSIQVPVERPDGQTGYFLCTVGKPEYTPPELQGADFSQVIRTPDHDNFGLAVLIFLMLMEGWHPFAAVWKEEGTPPSIEQRIQTGIFPYVGNWKQLRPKYAPPLEILPPRLRRLMIKCFVRRHKPSRFFWFFRLRRPGAHSWLRALKYTAKHLADCDQNPSHVYSDHLPSCPWCERMKLGIPDPFPRAAQTAVNTQVEQRPASQQQQPGVNGPSKTATKPRASRLKRGVIAILLILILSGLGLGLYFAYAHNVFKSTQTTPRQTTTTVTHATTPISTHTPVPTYTPKPKVTPSPTFTPTSTATPTTLVTSPNNNSSDSQGLVLQTILVLSIVLALIFIVLVGRMSKKR